MANRSNVAKIQLKIRNLIEGHASEDIVVYKYESIVVDQYDQGEKTFDAGTTVIGRATPDPTADELEFIGAEEQVDMMFVFSRLELIDKFPSAAEGDWLSNDDEILHNGLRYRNVKVWKAGRLDSTYSIIVVTALTPPGEGVP